MTKQDVIDSRPDQDTIDVGMEQLRQNQIVLGYDTKEYTIEILVKKFGNGGYDDEESDIYVPPYQRKFNWEPRRQSRFIESLLIGLPIPFLFFADMQDGRLEVVDGCQRLHTCRAFINDELVLEGLERVEKINGLRYSDLPKSEQRRFRNRSIRSVELSMKASEDDRRDLFDRINTGSLIPQDVEIRRGAYKGPMTDLIDVLATDKQFLALCPMTESDRRRRTGEELITRFFAFGDGLEGYRDNVGKFMSKWLKGVNDKAAEHNALIGEYRKRFDDVMQFVTKHFPFGFAKTETAKTTPRVRFQSIAVGTYWAIRDKPTLLDTGPAFNPTEWLKTDEFFLLTTSNAANVRSRILKRTEFVQYMLLGDRQEALCRADLLGNEEGV